MKVFNLCAKVTKRHLVSLGVYLGIFAVLAVMLTAFNNTSQSLSFEAVRPSAAIVNRDGESALVRGLEDFLAGYADMVKLEDDRTFPRAEALWRKIPGLPRPRGVTPICW